MIWSNQYLPLIVKLKSLGYGIEFETNGTITPPDDLTRLVDAFNVSFKLSNNLADPEDARIRPGALRRYNSMPNSWFKIVIADKRDLEELFFLIEKLQLDPSKVIVMPEGKDAQSLMLKSRWLADEAKKRNIRMMGRMHIEIWGNVRGT